MNMMRRLLDSLGSLWNTLPKSLPYLYVIKSSGTHSLVTISKGSLYFHTEPFRSDMPVKQVVSLEGADEAFLLTTVAAMGYGITLSSYYTEPLNDSVTPLMLSEVENVPITSGADLSVNLSGTWRALYPVYRALDKAAGNVDIALTQLQRDMAGGDWLDYWASFFNIFRTPGEDDNTFVRRFNMWLFNPKVNNIAIKELLKYQLKDDNFEVEDTAPNTFQVSLDIKYLSQAAAFNKILTDAKGAGIAYLLVYSQAPYIEMSYPQFSSALNGQAFSSLDSVLPIISKIGAETIAQPSEAVVKTIIKRLSEAYGIVQDNIDTAFTLGDSELDDPTSGVGEVFNDTTPGTLEDAVVAILTVNGQVLSTTEL